MTQELLYRTKRLGLMVIALVDLLPSKPSGWAIGKQIVRSATSVGANYRSTRTAKSKADFINKFKIVEEECDETLFWLEIIEEAGILKPSDIKHIKKEASELLSIFIASLRTLKSKP